MKLPPANYEDCNGGWEKFEEVVSTEKGSVIPRSESVSVEYVVAQSTTLENPLRKENWA